MCAKKTMESVAVELLSQKNLKLESCKVLQSLWAGYGHICHVTATNKNTAHGNAERVSLILKYISPPQVQSNNINDEGHIRKILSYQIEEYFYTHLMPRMPPEIGTASCIASMSSKPESGMTALLLEDLRLRFPVMAERRGELSRTQTYAALDWLAGFHGFWWSRTTELYHSGLCLPPFDHVSREESVLTQGSIWLNGGYTYLATRRSEYVNLSEDTESEWSKLLCAPESQGLSIAELVAEAISPPLEQNPDSMISRYVTLIHGDVKSENLFTTQDGKQAAFFDFQYVGLGLGVCDLAKLFTCSVSMDMLNGHVDEHLCSMGEGEETLLRYYHGKLQKVAGKEYGWDIFVRHWETALVDWLRFQASWGFWGNTAWLESRVRSITADPAWREWLMTDSMNQKHVH